MTDEHFHLERLKPEGEAVSVPIEPAVDNVIFKSKPLDLPEEVIQALLGEYETDVDGYEFTVTTHDDKFYATFTGNAPEEIKPYKLDESAVYFNLDRMRLEFGREGDKIVSLTLKMPFTTLEGRPKST